MAIQSKALVLLIGYLIIVGLLSLWESKTLEQRHYTAGLPLAVESVHRH